MCVPCARVDFFFHFLQAHEKLIGMNDAAKGGSAYLQDKIKNARDALIDDAPPEAPKEEPK